MNDVFTKADAEILRTAIVDNVRKHCDNGKENYILLSGGIDSCVVLYAVMELGLPYKVINFSGYGSHLIQRYE